MAESPTKMYSSEAFSLELLREKFEMLCKFHEKLREFSFSKMLLPSFIHLIITIPNFDYSDVQYSIIQKDHVAVITLNSDI